MGANDTANLGLRRPSNGETAWGANDSEGLNFNFSVMDAAACPSDGAGAHQTRIVAKSFSSLSLPSSTKLFSSIQAAIDDVTPGNQFPEPIIIYPAKYMEELHIRDRSVHLYGVAPSGADIMSGDYVRIASNQDATGGNTGRPCLKISLRSGEDDSNPNGQSLWAVSRNTHSTRNRCHIMVSNIFMDNYGQYFNDVAHDGNSVYFCDCTDSGTPAYHGMKSTITFNNCAFRGQTWKLHATDNTSPVSWFQYGFRMNAFATDVNFNQCSFAFLNYGGGSYGKGIPSFISQPFEFGTDGTSFVDWCMGPPNGAYEAVSYTGNVASDQKGYIDNKMSVKFQNCEIYAADGQGTFTCTGYTGNGWTYGELSDTSNAIITLHNNATIQARDCVLKPALWGVDEDYGSAHGEDNLIRSNWITLYNDPSSSQDVGSYNEQTLRSDRVDDTICHVSGFDIDGSQRLSKSHVVMNMHRNIIGGYDKNFLD